MHEYKKLVCPIDVVKAKVGRDFRLESCWCISELEILLTAVHHHPAVNFFFGQLISIHVTHIHVISTNKRNHEAVMLASQAGSETSLQSCANLNKILIFGVSDSINVS